MQYETYSYEADPLVCPRCSGPLKIISLIGDGAVIEKILRHLKLWDRPERPPAGAGRGNRERRRAPFPLRVIASFGCFAKIAVASARTSGRILDIFPRTRATIAQHLGSNCLLLIAKPGEGGIEKHLTLSQ